MKDFLDYIAGRETHGKLSDRLRDEVIKSRNHEQWRLSYMLLEEKYREKLEEGFERGLRQGMEQGLEQGRAEERRKTEAERMRADAAETRIKELEAQINELTS